MFFTGSLYLLSLPATLIYWMRLLGCGGAAYGIDYASSFLQLRPVSHARSLRCAHLTIQQNQNRSTNPIHELCLTPAAPLSFFNTGSVPSAKRLWRACITIASWKSNNLCVLDHLTSRDVNHLRLFSAESKKIQTCHSVTLYYIACLIL